LKNLFDESSGQVKKKKFLTYILIMHIQQVDTHKNSFYYNISIFQAVLVISFEQSLSLTEEFTWTVHLKNSLEQFEQVQKVYTIYSIVLYSIILYSIKIRWSYTLCIKYNVWIIWWRIWWANLSRHIFFFLNSIRNSWSSIRLNFNLNPSLDWVHNAHDGRSKALTVMLTVNKLFKCFHHK